jgi:hypothetical protein
VVFSALARRSSYRCASGANLIAEGEPPSKSRLDDDYLAAAVEHAWHRLYGASETELDKAREQQPSAYNLDRAPPDRRHFNASIGSLRAFLELEHHYPGQSGTLKEEDAGEPAIHVLGYSLGGFTAQSVFMSWPYLISSCVTLLAGGALRELAPTAFAHPEEWQTVLHSLRYELDDRMMQHVAAEADVTPAGGGLVWGVEVELFTYLKRTFYEVFQQEYRGSFQTRLEAFRQRMLFVVGGNDTVVRPRTVLDSGPPGGINLLEIAGLGHFLGGSANDEEERQQRAFWLPEMATLIDRFADNAASGHHTTRRLMWFDEKINKPLLSKIEWDLALGQSARQPSGHHGAVLRLAAAERLAIESDGSLPGELFDRCLDDLLARTMESQASDGMLFILRNEVPTMLLGDGVIRERGAALYHDDLRIVRFCHGASMRREVMRENIERICLVLPWNAKSTMLNIDADPGYPSQSESAGGQVGERQPVGEMWMETVARCKKLSAGAGRDSVRRFDGNTILTEDRIARLPETLVKMAKEFSGRETPTRVAAIPDCWIWVSREFLLVAKALKLPVGRAIGDLARVVPDQCADEEELIELLRNDHVRIVTVSRARYNPRFRGRLIVSAHDAKKLLVHSALCVALSERIDQHDPDSGFA